MLRSTLYMLSHNFQSLFQPSPPVSPMNEKIKSTTAAAADATGEEYSEIDSCCSTPYVSAPSSPTRGGFYYSAPASPMHFVLSSTAVLSSHSSAVAAAEGNYSFEFDFCGGGAASADELFLNGQIRPMKLSTHLRHPQNLTPLVESDDVADDDPMFSRGRDLKFRAGSLRRRTRSMSPMRTSPDSFRPDGESDDRKTHSTGQFIRKLSEEDEEKGSTETTPCASRSSSAGRSSKRWVFLKEFLSRSKSEGRNKDGQNHKFWSSLSFSPAKDKKSPATTTQKLKDRDQVNQNPNAKKRTVLKNGSTSKRRGAAASPWPSAHELHYTLNRAQSEEMRKKTFLPYRQGLLGCLGFSSRSYGAMNGLARALNPVYSS